MARNNIVDISSMLNLKKVGRSTRKPTHPFALRWKPWAVQPFLIAPVWPGETMTNLLLQSRVVTDPISNPLIGWWVEYYFYYVKLRDLSIRDDLTAMLVTNAPAASLASAASMDHYHAAGGINYVEHCLQRIVEKDFRDDGEAFDGFKIGNLPAAKISGNSWLDSAILHDDTVGQPFEGSFVLGEDVFPGQIQPPPGFQCFIPSGFEDAYGHWEAMRAMQLTTVDFEDWLKTFGVSVPKEDVDPHEPELLRYVRHWQYPSNTVNPDDGSVASAVSWSVAERADKDRFFREPGFVFGVTVARPKVYLNRVKGTLSSFLNDAFSWLPAVLQEAPYTSLKKFAFDEGPLAGNTGEDDYWVDLRDLAMHGEQFVNFALTETDAGMVALPTAGMQKKYPADADVAGLFKGASQFVRADGRVDLTIKTRLEDTSL